jgi:hypothetical protein
MRTWLASGSIVETVVTLGAAALMTVAGFAIVKDLVVFDSGGTVASAIVAAPRAPAPSG